MKIVTIALVLFVAISPIGKASEPVKADPVAATAWLAKTPAVQILDVRTKEEFTTGHLAKATLIPWTDEDFKTRAAKELDPKKPVFVYCRSGKRSAEAAAALVKLGFTDIHTLEGGLLAWQKAGKPIVKADGTPRP